VKRTPLQPSDRVAQPGHRADDRDRRSLNALSLGTRGDPCQRVHDRALPRVSPALHHGCGLVRVAASRGEPLGDQRQIPDAHVEDERPGEAGERLPVECGLGLVGVLVAGNERDRGGGIAVRDRDARVRRSGNAGRHTRHHLERHARSGERLGLLTAAPEHERVATLQAHHALAGSGKLDQQPVRLLLGDRSRAGLLADIAQLRLRPRPLERAGRDQPVVEDRVRARDQLE
jgi:hypothetical protein